MPPSPGGLPPLHCSRCGTDYFVQADYFKCRCGCDLWRVAFHNGRLVGPPSMPPHVLEQMEQAFRARFLTAKQEQEVGESWVKWCEQNRVDPDTADERQIDRFLGPNDIGPPQWRDGAQKDFYDSWDDY